MLGPRYRDFIDAIKRYVGASIDQKPISLSTIIFVGGGGVAMRSLGMALMFAAHLTMAWFSTPSDLGNYFILIGVTNIVDSCVTVWTTIISGNWLDRMCFYGVDRHRPIGLASTIDIAPAG
jgi:hypothetical protein